MEEKQIVSVKGGITIKQEQNIICVSHQYLTPIASTTSYKPLTLQNIEYHRQNPYSLQNASLTPTLIEHQLINAYGTNSTVVVVDCSDSKQKLSQVFGKYIVVKGYQFALPSNSMTAKEKEAIMNQKHIYKQLQYQFNHSTGAYKPGFIGQLNLPSLVQSQYLPLLLKTYNQYGIQYGCPTIINLLPIGEQGYQHSWNAHHPLQTQSQSYTKMLKILYESIKDFSKIIVYNPIIILSTCAQQNSIQTINTSQRHIHQLYQKGITVGFDLLRYQDNFSLSYIAQYSLKYPNQTILSSGLRYKTDLKNHGGDGITSDKAFYFLKKFIKQELLYKIQNKNMFDKLNWYTKLIVIKEVKMWTCTKCQGQFPQTTEAFRKFGKDFCSINCLKGYKF